MSDGAKVALGAAALLGVAALVHKSHDRDDRNYDDEIPLISSVATATGSTTTASTTEAAAGNTADGYNKGVDERRHQSSYRYSDRQFTMTPAGRAAHAEGDYCRVDGTGTHPLWSRQPLRVPQRYGWR